MNKPSSLAKKLRANPTSAEVRMWRLLYPFRTGGFHFRKQHAIGRYVVDFVCIHASLVIEVDGNTHGTEIQIANDALRDDYLRGRGFAVLHFTNEEVLTHADGVFATVEAALNERGDQRRSPPSPTLPARGRVPIGVPGPGVPRARNRISPLAEEGAQRGPSAGSDAGWGGDAPPDREGGQH